MDVGYNLTVDMWQPGIYLRSNTHFFVAHINPMIFGQR